MTDPDPLTELLSKPWPLPEPMDGDTYQREAIETARSEQQEKQWNASQPRS